MGLLLDRLDAAWDAGRLPLSCEHYAALLAVLFPEQFGQGPPRRPTDALPGTPGKCAALAGRLARKEALHHDRDAADGRPGGERRALALGSDEAPGGRRRKPAEGGGARDTPGANRQAWVAAELAEGASGPQVVADLGRVPVAPESRTRPPPQPPPDGGPRVYRALPRRGLTRADEAD